MIDSPLKRQQRGGTILGFCLGLLAGLLIALGISIMVNKVPMTIKGDPNSRNMTLEEELQRNRNWDPNAPLRSRTPNLNDEKEASDGAGGGGDATDGTTADTADTDGVLGTGATDNAPAQQAAAQPGNANSSGGDPLGDLARAVAGQAGNTTSSDDNRLIFFVQTGAYRNASLAEEQRVRLSLVGFSARVTEREQAGRPIYRVRLGPFDSREAAQRSKTKLESHDFVGSLVRVPR